MSEPRHPTAPAAIRLPRGTEVVDHGTWGVASTPHGESCLRLTPAEAAWMRLAIDRPGEAEAQAADFLPLLDAIRSAGWLEPAKPPRRLAVTRSGIEVDGANRWLTVAHQRGLRHLARPSVLAVCAAVAVVGAAALVPQLRSSPPVTESLSPAIAGIVLLLLELLATLLHETAHGLVLVHHGRKVRRVGFGFYWGAPSYYVDATEALLLPRRQRIAQTAAGPFADAFLAGVASLAALALDGTAGSICLLFAVLLWISTATNLVPFLELDGYWILADALDRPQLRSEATAATRQLLTHPLQGWSRLAVYGLASSVAGIVLLGVAVVGWWAVVGDVARDLATEGPVGWLLVVPLVLPTVAGWVALAFQAAAAMASPLRRPRPA